MHFNCKNIKNQRFGKLVALNPTKERRRGCVVWHCVCDCGNICEVISGNLQSRHTQSCGCLQKELLVKRNTIHGMRNTPTYKSWKQMFKRCRETTRKDYKYYGGRGIKVCKRWHKFENFLEDMGERPEGKTLDRWPDNDGDYELRNCRWATRKEQANNRRKRIPGARRRLFSE